MLSCLPGFGDLWSKPARAHEWVRALLKSPELQSSPFCSRCFTGITAGTIHPCPSHPTSHSCPSMILILTFPFLLQCVLIWDNPLYSYQVDGSPVYHFLSPYSGPGSGVMTGIQSWVTQFPAPKNSGMEDQGKEGKEPLNDNAKWWESHTGMSYTVWITGQKDRWIKGTRQVPQWKGQEDQLLIDVRITISSSEAGRSFPFKTMYWLACLPVQATGWKGLKWKNTVSRSYFFRL